MAPSPALEFSGSVTLGSLTSDLLIPSPYIKYQLTSSQVYPHSLLPLTGDLVK